MNIAIIPARAGSQRIPGKNIKSFCGEPIISYPIKSALSSKYIEKVIVSTDSEEIGKIAEHYGAHVPFIRPKDLSDNFTPTAPVIKHTINHLTEAGWDIYNACCIYPCTPLLGVKELDDVYEIFISQKTAFAYPVVQYPHPIQRALRILDDNRIEFVFPDNELKRTQDFEITYHDAGQFYWGTSSAWIEQKRMHTDGMGVIMTSSNYIDIDDENDWSQAELIKRSIG